MLIRVSDPTVLPALIGDLEQRAHYVVKQAGADRGGVTGEIGPIAPGLHNGKGGEITFGGCS